MQDIDLGDRRGLIDLIYGPPKETTSSSPSLNTMAPLTENKRNEKKEKSRVSCSLLTAIILFVLVGLAIFLSGWTSHFLTKEEYEKKLAMASFVPQPRRNLSQLTGEPDLEYEEEEPASGPSAEELRLPGTLEPIWYNVTLKAYLPGYVSFDGKKNLTTEVDLMIKIKAKEQTNMIVLNSRQFDFPSDFKKIQILVEERSNRLRRDVATENNSTEISDTTLAEDVAAASTTAGTTVSPKKTTVTPVKKYESLVDYSPSGIMVTDVKFNETLQKVTFTLSKALNAGQEVVFKLPFTGVISDSLNGLYASTYKTKDGKSKTLAVTSLLPTNARKLLPCFDEPQFKAPIKLSVVHPVGTVVRANGAEQEDGVKTEDSEWVRTSFAESSPSSTYQTAFIISDFKYKEANTKSGVKVRVWSRPDALNNTDYALESAVKTIDFLEEYYGSQMTYKKQDLFAIPEFESSAVENPGLMMFHETSLLFDSTSDDVTTKIRIAQKVAHEINHQWFGNLVTLSGWDSLWINEAFANYMEYFTLEKTLDGKVNMMHHELSQSIEAALSRDAQSSSHPLTVHADTAREAMETFDMITYEKGAAIVRMIKSIVGEEAFRKGIQTYLSAFKNGPANYTQLWKSLSSAAPKTLKSWDGQPFDLPAFANQWILQMGFPVLDVYRIDAHTVEITQRRFKLDNLTPEKAKYRNALFWYKWDVPLYTEINGEKKEMQWLHEAVRLPLNLSDSLLINSESLGFYRVNYDEKGWADIASQLNEDHTKYTAAARGRILSDAFALAYAGQLPYETVLGLTGYLTKETEYVPTKTAIVGLTSIYDSLEDTDEGDKIKNMIIEKLSVLHSAIDMTTLSTSDEAQFLEVKRKQLIIRSLCQLSPKSCKKTMTSQFSDLLDKCQNNNYSSQCSPVPAPLRSSVYCNGVAMGDEETYDVIMTYAKNEVSATERRSLMKALGCSRSPHTLKKLLRESLDKKSATVSKQDLQTVVKSMRSQPVGRLVIPLWIVDQWKNINEKLAEDRDVIKMLLKAGLTIDNEREIKQMERFLAEHRSSTRGLGVFRQKLESARSKVNWQKKNRKQITDFFAKKTDKKEL